MAPKIHLFLSSHPLRPGESVVARCGDVVPKVVILQAWDNVPTGTKIDWPAIGICGKCLKAAEKKHKGPLLVYAISERVYGKAEQKTV